MYQYLSWTKDPNEQPRPYWETMRIESQADLDKAIQVLQAQGITEYKVTSEPFVFTR